MMTAMKCWNVCFKLKQKFPLNFVILLKTYYDLSYGRIKNINQLSDQFKINCGVKQGGVISPFLYNLYINDLLLESLSLNIGA